MKLIWRDMLLSAVAWLCGVGALHYFSEMWSFRPGMLSDWFTFAMFNPLQLLAAGLLLAAGTVLLSCLIVRNASALWRLCRRGRLRLIEALLHLCVLALAILVLTVQWLKVPVATTLLLGVIAFAGLLRTLRNRAVKRETTAWQTEKHSHW